MAHETLRIEFAGTEITALYDDLMSLEVALDEELAGTFRLTVALPQLPDGTFRHLDDERLAPWQKVVITGGPAGGEQQLISGFVTHVRPEFADTPEECLLHVWGMDATVVMDRDDVLRDWPGMRDSEIAEAVLRGHGFDPRVIETPVIHDKDLSTVVQRETDMQFLRRLAQRNGYECFVEGRIGWFRPPEVLPTSALPVLAVLFGEETNVVRFELDVDALAPSAVAMTQVDRTDRTVVTSTAATSQLPALGRKPIADYLPAGFPPGRVVLSQLAATGTAEMDRLCAALCDEGSWFVTGEGEVDGNDYGGVLLPRATVTVKGVGATHSGAYVVTRVNHRFTPDGYRQVFGVKRNALRPKGTEVFTATDSALPVAGAAAVILAEVTS
jgi:phage protein D